VLLLRFFDIPRIVGDNMIAIGSDDGSLIVVNDKLEILSIDDNNSEFIRFVNSSPHAFVGCISAYKEYKVEVRNSIAEKEKSCVTRLKNKIEEIDSAALSGENNWWSCIISQAFEGNL